MDYSKFTDRSRKVMQLANQEAQRFNHDWVGTEHVLLALIKEGCGVAANVLKNLGVDLRKIRAETEKIVKPGPDMVTMGKLPYTPRTTRVLEYAAVEAASLNHSYVGTEHLLLGLLREWSGVAADVLKNLGVKAEDVRAEVLILIPPTEARVDPAEETVRTFVVMNSEGRMEYADVDKLSVSGEEAKKYQLRQGIKEKLLRTKEEMLRLLNEGAVHPCRSPSVDPLWDRYFEMAFERALSVLMHAPDTQFAKESGGSCSLPQWAAETADRAVAERAKRAK